MRQVAQPFHKEANMIQLTSTSGPIKLNPAAITSLVPARHVTGTTVTMMTGHQHRVAETVREVEKRIEEARHAGD